MNSKIIGRRKNVISYFNYTRAKGLVICLMAWLPIITVSLVHWKRMERNTLWHYCFGCNKRFPLISSLCSCKTKDTFTLLLNLIACLTSEIKGRYSSSSWCSIWKPRLRVRWSTVLLPYWRFVTGIKQLRIGALLVSNEVWSIVLHKQSNHLI